MLEDTEMKYILTDDSGKVLGAYGELENAEMDAKDLVETKEGDHKLCIYELQSAQKIGEPYLQNLYILRRSYPETDTSEEKSDE